MRCEHSNDIVITSKGDHVHHDEVWIESPIGRTHGRAIWREGVRPDVAVAL
ncbi:MAG TPA: hypothetical protein VF982_09835 [Anaerolineales bacterium]